MDQIVFDGDEGVEQVACKVSLVNDKGQIVLDTLINYEQKAIQKRLGKRKVDYKEEPEFLLEIWSQAYKVQSLKEIHKIELTTLKEAPSMQEVVKHIVKLMEDFKDQTGEQVGLIGHNVLNDIEALFLNQATYIDTTNFRFKSDQKGLIKKFGVCWSISWGKLWGFEPQ